MNTKDKVEELRATESAQDLVRDAWVIVRDACEACHDACESFDASDPYCEYARDDALGAALDAIFAAENAFDSYCNAIRLKLNN